MSVAYNQCQSIDPARNQRMNFVRSRAFSRFFASKARNLLDRYVCWSSNSSSRFLKCSHDEVLGKGLCRRPQCNRCRAPGAQVIPAAVQRMLERRRHRIQSPRKDVCPRASEAECLRTVVIDRLSYFTKELIFHVTLTVVLLDRN